jgi:phage gpG-like protein
LSFTPTLTRARDWIAQDTADCFAQSRDIEGNAWAPRKHQVPWKPLVKSGLLYLSVIDQIDSGAIANNVLTIRVNFPGYAAFHQLGTSRMVARPFLGISDKTREKVYKDAAMEMVKGLLGKLTGSGGAI